MRVTSPHRDSEVPFPSALPSTGYSARAWQTRAGRVWFSGTTSLLLSYWLCSLIVHDLHQILLHLPPGNVPVLHGLQRRVLSSTPWKLPSSPARLSLTLGTCDAFGHCNSRYLLAAPLAPTPFWAPSNVLSRQGAQPVGTTSARFAVQFSRRLGAFNHLLTLGCPLSTFTDGPLPVLCAYKQQQMYAALC